MFSEINEPKFFVDPEPEPFTGAGASFLTCSGAGAENFERSELEPEQGQNKIWGSEPELEPEQKFSKAQHCLLPFLDTEMYYSPEY